MCKEQREKKNNLEEIFKELREAEIPLFIWGAGSMSVEVENCLKEQGILAEGFFMDVEKESAYIIEGERQIYSLEEIMESYESINVVMGHGHFEKRHALDSCSFIRKVYIIPNPYPQYRMKGIGAYLAEHKGEVELAMNVLADDTSRKALKAYLRVKETDDIHYLLEKEFCIGGIFDFEELRLTNTENYVDVGAWIGDTISLFTEKVSDRYQSITAIEADAKNFAKLQENMRDKKDISLYPCGVGKENETLYLKKGNSKSAYLSEESGNLEDAEKMEIKTLDILFEKEKMSLIKIGVPFLFLDVLKGGEEAIKRDKPRMVVNVAADDGLKVFDTIKWIESLQLNYKIALRFDFPMPTRLHLYAY